MNTTQQGRKLRSSLVANGGVARASLVADGGMLARQAAAVVALGGLLGARR